METIVYEIIRHSLYAIAREMKVAMMQAHINEHMGFGYRVMIEQALGMVLPPQTDEDGNDIALRDCADDAAHGGSF